MLTVSLDFLMMVILGVPDDVIMSVPVDGYFECT
jgi:hypothetical protein